MVERKNNLNDENIENEFGEILSRAQQSLMKAGVFSKDEISKSEDNFIRNNHKDEEDESDDSSDTATSDNDSEDSPNFRDKDKELKEFVKNQLSLEAQDVINMNEDEFNEIIAKLKQKGLTKEKGVELQNLRDIKKGRGGISI